MRQLLPGVSVRLDGTAAASSTTIAAVGASVLVFATALPDDGLTLTSCYLARSDRARRLPLASQSRQREPRAAHTAHGEAARHPGRRVPTRPRERSARAGGRRHSDRSQRRRRRGHAFMRHRRLGPSHPWLALVAETARVVRERTRSGRSHCRATLRDVLGPVAIQPASRQFRACARRVSRGHRPPRRPPAPPPPGRSDVQNAFTTKRS